MKLFLRRTKLISIRPRQRPPEEDPDEQAPDIESFNGFKDPVEEKRHRRLLEDASHHYCSLPGSNVWNQRNQWAQPGVPLPTVKERIGGTVDDDGGPMYGGTRDKRVEGGMFGWTVDAGGQPLYDGSLAMMTAREQSEVQEALEALDPPQEIDPFIVARLIDEHQPELYRLRAEGWQELDSLLILIRSLWSAKRILDKADYYRRYNEEHRDEIRERAAAYYREHRDERLIRNRIHWAGLSQAARDRRNELRRQTRPRYAEMPQEYKDRQNERRRQLRMLKASWDLKERRSP